MRALRLGSYSMAATLAGTPSLLRRKSMIRYSLLWPPPRWRAVLRPCTLRPPDLGRRSVSAFSGSVLVISEKSETLWKRRPGDVGLRRTIGISLPLEQLDGVALGQRDHRVLARRGLAVAAGAAGAAAPCPSGCRGYAPGPPRRETVCRPTGLR